MRAERKPKAASAQVRLYVFATAILGLLTASVALSRWGLPTWHQVAFFWALNALVLVVGRVEVPVSRMALATEDRRRGVILSPSFVILLTAAYATSPSTALIVALIPALPELIARDDVSLLKVIFNAAQEAVYVGAASIVFATLKGQGGAARAFGAAAAAAVIAQTLNTTLVAGVIALSNRVALRETLRRMMWIVPHSFGFGFVALMIATLYGRSGPAAAIFLLMPLIAMRVVRQAKLGLDRQREDTLTDFVRAVEAKDPYTFRHSERVAAITVELHRELGARAAELEKRWYAALLHDVGKVAVPEEILTKTTALTDAEYDAIKAHPGFGADIVSKIDLLKELCPEIRAHHERMDGRGYPDSLQGEQIPASARILAVADAFDALTSDRPYRVALSEDEALRELRRCAGLQHDPEVVGALERVLENRLSLIRPGAQQAGLIVQNRAAAAQ